jgi:hypothetical protein
LRRVFLTHRPCGPQRRLSGGARVGAERRTGDVGARGGARLRQGRSGPPEQRALALRKLVPEATDGADQLDSARGRRCDGLPRSPCAGPHLGSDLAVAGRGWSPLCRRHIRGPAAPYPGRSIQSPLRGSSVGEAFGRAVARGEVRHHDHEPRQITVHRYAKTAPRSGRSLRPRVGVGYRRQCGTPESNRKGPDGLSQTSHARKAS